MADNDAEEFDMLNILGSQPSRFCDGRSRRQFFKEDRVTIYLAKIRCHDSLGEAANENSSYAGLLET